MTGWTMDRWIGVIGTATGLIGIVASIWMWRRSRREVELKFRSADLRLIGPNDVESPLTGIGIPLLVTYDGRAAREVSKLFLVVWNDGRKTLDPISAGIAASPLRIVLPQGSAFWGDIRVLKVSRPEIAFTAAIHPSMPTEALLEFDFLDHQDGFLLEALCAGPVEGASLQGVFKGAKALKHLGNLQLQSDLSLRERLVQTIVFCLTRGDLMILMGIFLVVGFAAGWGASGSFLQAILFALSAVVFGVTVLAAFPGSLEDRGVNSKVGSMRGVPRPLRKIPVDIIRPTSATKSTVIRLLEDVRTDLRARRDGSVEQGNDERTAG